MKKFLVGLSLALGLSACGSQGVMNMDLLAQQTPKDKAKLVVSRDSSMYGFATAVNVDVNGRRIASLGRGGSVVNLTTPGETNLAVASVGDFGNFLTSFQASGGKTYYFEITTKSGYIYNHALKSALWGDIITAINTSQNENSGMFKVMLKEIK